MCNACKDHSATDTIDWKRREKDFVELIHSVEKNSTGYDCIIPVSGGKDSTWQVVTALEYGLKPLCVTWKTPARTKIGEENLQNLISLGIDHVDFSIDPNVEKRFTKRTFERMGNPLIPMHMALHALPVQFATKFHVPLILWGENSAQEYGSDDQNLKGFKLTRTWFEKFGVTNGTSALDWVSNGLSEKDLLPYMWPQNRSNGSPEVMGVFLGHFFRWTPQMSYDVARKNGFQAGERPRTGYYEFADIDDDFMITIHHWLKWYKFGFTRLWDNLSIEIRNGRMSRSDALKIIVDQGDELPRDEIHRFCEYIEISTNRFFEIAETFRNPEVWKRSPDGTLYIDGFPIEGWEWRTA